MTGFNLTPDQVRNASREIGMLATDLRSIRSAWDGTSVSHAPGCISPPASPAALTAQTSSFEAAPSPEVSVSKPSTPDTEPPAQRQVREAGRSALHSTGGVIAGQEHLNLQTVSVSPDIGYFGGVGAGVAEVGRCGMVSTLSREEFEQQVEETFDAVDKLDEQVVVIEQTLPDQAREIQAVMTSLLRQVPPLGAVLAGKLLEVDRKTVSSWAEQGLLVVVDDGSPRRRYDPVRLHQVRHVVRQLREAGQSRNLLDAIWFHLEDQAVMQREDLTQSLRELREGDVVEAY